MINCWGKDLLGMNYGTIRFILNTKLKKLLFLNNLDLQCDLRNIQTSYPAFSMAQSISKLDV